MEKSSSSGCKAGWISRARTRKVTCIAFVADCEGGYKAMRRFLLQTLEKPAPMLRLAGQTGTGKTELLKQLMAEGHPGIDLEGLANHKGSSFGRSPDDHQPTPINFENALAIDWLKARHAIKNRPGVPILVEDEGRAIGRLAQPLGFFDHFRTQPLIILTAPFEERVNRMTACHKRFKKTLIYSTGNG